jgi:hypothetical protein
MSAPTLDSRIAAALSANGKASKDDLVALVAEAEQAIAAARDTIATEGERALDITNDDPDASDAAIQKAERNLARLDKALPLLRDRIRQIEATEYARQWHAAADRIESERDKLAGELAERYPAFVEKLAALFDRIDALDGAIGQLHSAAPRGETRRLVGAEPQARGLQSFSAAQPALRDHLALPDLSEPSRIAYPPQVGLNPLAGAMIEAAQAIERKSSTLYSSDWHVAEKLAAEQARAESDRLAALEAAKQAEAKRKFEQAVLADDRRRQTGGAP